MTQINIMAIDPGAAGGLAMYAPGLNPQVTCSPMPDDVAQRDALQIFSKIGGECVCYMELVGGYIPDKDGNGQPGSAMFNFGDGYGYLRGLLAAYKIKLVLVRPQKWQIGIPGAAQKDAAKKRALKEHAARMFPQLDNITLKTADALCILNYAMGIELQQFTMVKEKDFVLKPTSHFSRAINRVGIDCHRQDSDTPPTEKEFNKIESDYLAKSYSKRVPIVATVDLPLKEQYKLAEAWAKTTGHELPKRKTVAWSAMFTYWLNNIAPQ